MTTLLDPSSPAAAAAAAPMISVIIPVYNRLQYLAQAVESVLSQTHPNVEVIVVSDGSQLDPGPVLAHFGDKVRFLKKSNGGLPSARNFGIRHAAGEYLAFLDDDDYLEPDALEQLLTALAGSPESIWAAGKFRYVSVDGAPTKLRQRCSFSSGDIYPPMILNNLMGAPSVVLVHARSLERLGCFDEQFILSEDWELWLTLARESPVVAVDKVVSNYRVHGQQISRTQWVRQFDYNLRVLRKHQALCREGFHDLFEAGIAKLYLSHGDNLYFVAGDHRGARENWRQAYRRGALHRTAFWYRLVKSWLPVAWARAARALAAHLRRGRSG